MRASPIEEATRLFDDGRHEDLSRPIAAETLHKRVLVGRVRGRTHVSSEALRIIVGYAGGSERGRGPRSEFR
ncbi:MAG: hypothetical protein WEA81_00595, partial [Dehalococcoidia bacterium]